MALVRLLPQMVLQFFDDLGAPLAGGKLHFYEAGTTTEKDTYSDEAATTPNENPIDLDSAGRPINGVDPVQIFLKGDYKLVVKDVDGVEVRTEDNINSVNEFIDQVEKTGNYTIVEDDRNKVIISNPASSDNVITLPSISEVGSGFQVTILLMNNNWNTTVRRGSTDWIVSSGNSEVELDFISQSITLISRSSNIWSLVSSHGIWSQFATVDAFIKTSDDGLDVRMQDTRTSTVDNVLNLTSSTSGTAASGIGVSATFKAKSADEDPSDLGSLNFSFSDVSSGSEDSVFTIQTRNAGAALSDAYNFSISDTGEYSFTGAPTSERTITLPDNDVTLVTYGGRATRGSAQSIADNTVVKVNLDTLDWGDSNNFDVVTNRRFTVPAGAAGKYLICASVSWASLDDSNHIIETYIYKNGSKVVQAAGSKDGTGVNLLEDPAVSVILDLVEADYIELHVRQNNADNVSHNLNEASLSLIRIGT